MAGEFPENLRLNMLNLEVLVMNTVQNKAIIEDDPRISFFGPLMRVGSYHNSREIFPPDLE